MSWPNRLLAFLLERQDARLVEQLAEQTAQQCRTALYDSVRKDAIGMTPEMLRGYVRAYAAGFVATELAKAPIPPEMADDFRPRVAAAAVEHLVDLVVADLLHAQPGARTLAAAA